MARGCSKFSRGRPRGWKNSKAKELSAKSSWRRGAANLWAAAGQRLSPGRKSPPRQPSVLVYRSANPPRLKLQVCDQVPSMEKPSLVFVALMVFFFYSSTTGQRKPEKYERTRRYSQNPLPPFHKVQNLPALTPQLVFCRLYEQLEEVQQQRAFRSRQEAATQNRLKVKEFHQVKYYKCHLLRSRGSDPVSLFRKLSKGFVPSRPPTESHF